LGYAIYEFLPFDGLLTGRMAANNNVTYCFLMTKSCEKQAPAVLDGYVARL
jgi:hypothetical protein